MFCKNKKGLSDMMWVIIGLIVIIIAGVIIIVINQGLLFKSRDVIGNQITATSDYDGDGTPDLLDKCVCDAENNCAGGDEKYTGCPSGMNPAEKNK